MRLYDKPIITVTGTNGKGSVLAFCESILLAQNYNIAAYYSPHVFDIGERIKINGQFNYLDSPVVPFDFKIFTQKAFELFTINNLNLDAVLLEVGIGGRCDPVNLWAEPEVSVVTNIELDHQDKLGNSLDQIAFEKAHVFRTNRPAIIGQENIPDRAVKYGEKIKADLYYFKKNYDYKIYENYWEFYNFKYNLKNLPIPQLNIHNAAIALEALSHFSLNISEASIRAGLTSANLPGRFKVIKDSKNNITQIFDVAHNPDSAKLLAKNLEKYKLSEKNTGKIIGVLGVLKDKDIRGIIESLANKIDIWVIGQLVDPRAVSTQEIQAYLPEGTNSVLFADIYQAYGYALKEAKPGDNIVVFGSFRTVGALCPERN